MPRRDPTTRLPIRADKPLAEAFAAARTNYNQHPAAPHLLFDEWVVRNYLTNYVNRDAPVPRHPLDLTQPASTYLYLAPEFVETQLPSRGDRQTMMLNAVRCAVVDLPSPPPPPVVVEVDLPPSQYREWVRRQPHPGGPLGSSGFRATDRLWDRLSQSAEDQGVSVSEIIRDLLAAYVTVQDVDKAAQIVRADMRTAHSIKAQ